MIQENEEYWEQVVGEASYSNLTSIKRSVNLWENSSFHNSKWTI